MNTDKNNARELSCFQLKLSYMSEHHPKVTRYGVYHSTSRCGSDHLLRCAVAQNHAPRGGEHGKRGFVPGETHLQVRRLSVVGKTTEELPAPLPEKLAPILLSNEAVQATFDKFEVLTDIFAAQADNTTAFTPE